MDRSMNHMDMGSMPMMPGMLTPAQMKALAAANGPAFDHLFLTGMIQHHTGALVMVKDLFATPGAGQDPQLFDFASDVDNTQRAEINIMRDMLKGEKMIVEITSRFSRSVADQRDALSVAAARPLCRPKRCICLYQPARGVRRSARRTERWPL